MKVIAWCFVVLFSVSGYSATSCLVNPTIHHTIDNDSIDFFKVLLMKQFLSDCEADISVNSPETNSNYLYWAARSITVSDGYRITANTSSVITMKAGKVIVLKPRTTILRGNHYLARIEACVSTCESSFTYDKFFTPNGDGVNDFWNVKNLENMTNVKIFIFDRYGKSLQIISPETPGWDGKYNSIPIFGNDYWFHMTYSDCNGIQREIKSHFSLLR